MNDKEHGVETDRPERDPAFFLFRRFVTLGQSVGIVKGQDRCLKAHSVLDQVPFVLRFIPFKTHGRFRRRSSS